MKRGLVILLLASATAPCAMAQPQASSEAVTELVVTAPSPLGGGLDKAKVGSTVYTLKADDFEKTGSLSVTEALARDVPGLNVSDTQGNPFAGDVNYRGFVASPLQGVPQGLAVYLNGQRLNEAFGDTMNWDLIPQTALSRADLVTSNPAFGLNALGGSINLQTFNGFTFNGLQAQAQGGSFGSRTASVQGGWNNGKTSFFGAVDGGQEDGWRQHSDSDLIRGFADIGFKFEGGEIHLQGGASTSNLGVVGPTPVDLLDADRTAVFTYPQTTHNQAQFLALTGSHVLGGDWSVQGDLHYRKFSQRHVDGNDGDFERCASTGPLANTLCLEDDDFPSAIRPVAADFQLRTANNLAIPCPVSSIETNGCRNRISAADGPRVPYGTLDKTFTDTSTWGGAFNLANKGQLFGRNNLLTLGAAYDTSGIHFHSNSALALITPDLEVVTSSYAIPGIVGTVPGLGEIVHTAPSVGFGPADIDVDTWASGLYGSDTIDLAPNLFLTVGGRYNTTDVDTVDLTGVNPAVTGRHRFNRFNPAVSLAWKVGAGVTLFGGYSETNRAPTPLELSCSDPARPCLLENALVADPPLSQVVSKTFEVGARGASDFAGGRVVWSAAAFSTDNTDDIISLASNLNARGYFANVPKTRRQGYEAAVRYEQAVWSAYVNASSVTAEYRFNGTLASPNNPVADAAGKIAIASGDSMGGVPKIRIKGGVDLRIGDKLTLGVDSQYVSSQYFVGDEGNDNDKLPSYWTANLRADVAVTGKITLFGGVNNLLNKDYATYGTFFDADGVQKVRPQPLPLSPDEASITPAPPRAFYIGLKARF